MATAAKFRIDVAIHDLLMNSNQQPPAPAEAKGLTLPEPFVPRFPDRLKDPGPVTPPERRKWGARNCRAGQNSVIIRTVGAVAPCLPMYASTFDWGNIDHPKFDQSQLSAIKTTCQRHCFSTLNHNLAYCYNDARVIKRLWSSVIKNRFQGGVRSFED